MYGEDHQVEDHQVTVKIVFESTVTVEAGSEEDAICKVEQFLEKTDCFHFVEFKGKTREKAEGCGITDVFNNYEVEQVHRHC